MANPDLIVCPEDEWTLVAENVVKGQLHDKATRAEYYQTYRETGDAAPAKTDIEMRANSDENQAAISSGFDIVLVDI